MRFPEGSFTSPIFGNVKVAGIFQRLSKSGESCTRKQCLDKEIRDMAEIAQSLLVLRDHKVSREGAQSRVIVGSIVLRKILELVNDAVLGYYLNNYKSLLGTRMPFERLPKANEAKKSASQGRLKHFICLLRVWSC